MNSPGRTPKNVQSFTKKKQEKMQASLSAKSSTNMLNEYWALNDVGTCYFIWGEALTKKTETLKLWPYLKSSGMISTIR